MQSGHRVHYCCHSGQWIVTGDGKPHTLHFAQLADISGMVPHLKGNVIGPRVLNGDGILTLLIPELRLRPGFAAVKGVGPYLQAAGLNALDTVICQDG